MAYNASNVGKTHFFFIAVLSEFEVGNLSNYIRSPKSILLECAPRGNVDFPAPEFTSIKAKVEAEFITVGEGDICKNETLATFCVIF